MSAPPQPADRPPRGALRALLAAERTPFWYTLVVLLGGAAGTYFIAPMVNAEFETQRIKTDFVIRNYNDLRAKMEDFQGLYAVATQKLAAGEDLKAETFRLQEIVGRVTAQNLALMPMFSSADGPKAAAELTGAMNGMLAVLFANAEKKLDTPEALAAYQAEAQQATAKLVPPLLELYVRIGDVGRLRPTEKNVDLKSRPRG